MSKNVRLYRFYNLDQEQHGEPFAKCDAHVDAYKKGRKPAAPQLIMEKIADEAVWPCAECEHQESVRAERVRRAVEKQALAEAGAKAAGLTTEKLLGMLDTPDSREEEP